MESRKAFCPTLRFDPQVWDYFQRWFGSENLQDICKALCRPSLSTSLRVNILRTTPQDVLQKLGMLLPANTLADCQPAVHAGIDGIVVLKGMGPKTVDYSEEGLKEIVVDRKTGEAVLRGADVFVPGVLACSPGLSKGDRVAVCIALERPGSDWCGITRGTVLGSDHSQALDAVDRSSLYIGIGRAQMSRVELFRVRQGVAVTMEDPVFRIPSCSGLLIGDAMLQNLPSFIAAKVLAPRPGWRVIDMCAAPGGKTTAIAALMQDQGQVIALDRTHRKAASITALACEMGLTCINAYKMDACHAVLHDGQLQQDSAIENPVDTAEEINPKVAKRNMRKAAARAARGLDPMEDPGATCHTKANGFTAGSFDGVLLDAPCTALGLRPRLLHRQTMGDLISTASYQRKLLDVAVQLMKPGGSLVYSTCTINPGENEENVWHVLHRHPKMRLVSQEPHLGGPGLAGPMHSGGGVNEDKRLTDEQRALVQRFDPCSSLDTIGFFIAKFQKDGPELSDVLDSND
ncbi:unnamed protein product [Ostreobium quekettii]|uniref:SAM-dependent MTase RsmB/NOP-type domain-containing protein n=1 Tax=Ostreobium quekettii TaxID=121088 RepID=A0A8S1J7N6_9CHLO|nr:unnamed protein product [Ostreobium quekettii]